MDFIDTFILNDVGVVEENDTIEDDFDIEYEAYQAFLSDKKQEVIDQFNLKIEDEIVDIVENSSTYQKYKDVYLAKSYKIASDDYDRHACLLYSESFIGEREVFYEKIKRDKEYAVVKDKYMRKHLQENLPDLPITVRIFIYIIYLIGLPVGIAILLKKLF